MRGACPRGVARLAGISLRRAAIDDEAIEAAGEFEREATRMSLLRERPGRRRADIGDENRAIRLETLIAE